jgi:hypothetical protein
MSAHNIKPKSIKKIRTKIIHTAKTIDTRSHAFNVGIAIDYSPDMAIWLNHLSFWTEKNLAHEKHIHDGRVWCYDTLESLGEYFPYYSKRQLETIINNSVKEGLVVKGNYNQTEYDRTCWYALNPKAYFYFQHLLSKKNKKRIMDSISQICEIEITDLWNGFFRSVTPIPDTDPDTDPNTCVGDSEEPAAHTNLKKLKKDKAEEKALNCAEAQELFKSKFEGRTVTINQIFDDCKDHYEQKSLWATKDKFVKWLKREKPENYPQIDSHAGKKTTVVKLFTEEEEALLADYKHWLQTMSKSIPLENWFTKIETRERALAIYAREQEFLNADQGRVQANSK